MFKSFAVALLLASTVLAQDAPAAESCDAFLTRLDTDATLQKCLTTLVTATADYQAASNATSSPSDTKLPSTLEKLCAPSVDQACPESTLRGILSEFYMACSKKLTTELDQKTLRTYDNLYTFSLMKAAACSKDDTGKYCITTAKLPAGQTSAQMQQVLGLTGNTLNTDAAGQYNTAFLFLDGSAPPEVLCTTCGRNIINAYLAGEAKIANGPGIANSPFLKNQPKLYKDVQDKCGANFLTAGSVQAAGGISGSPLADGAVHTASQTFLIAGMGIASLVALSVF